jgi:hypothetical protein
VLDPDASLTPEEILSRFKRLFNREMTPEEKKAFFLDHCPLTARKGKYLTLGCRHGNVRSVTDTPPTIS